MIIYFINIIKKTIYIIFIIIFLSFILSKHSFASDNIFTVEELEVSGQIDLQFSRNNMIEQAFKIALDNLLSQILDSSDYKKIDDLHTLSVLVHSKPYGINLEEEVSKVLKRDIFAIGAEVDKFIAIRNDLRHRAGILKTIEEGYSLFRESLSEKVAPRGFNPTPYNKRNVYS